MCAIPKKMIASHFQQNDAICFTCLRATVDQSECRRSLKRTQQYSKLWTPQVRRVEYGVESRGSRMPASTREPSVPAGDDHTRAGKAGALCGALLWFDPGGGLLPSRPQDILG